METTNKGTLVYRSREDDKELRALPLKTRSCHIKYYTEFELSSFDKMICSFLKALPDNTVSYKELGYQLGFDVDDKPMIDSFYDEAEDHILSMMLRDSQKWGLISIDNDYISLTSVGQLALDRNKKYSFHEADINSFEFQKLTKNESNNIPSFPFNEELGKEIVLTHVKDVEYDDHLVDYVLLEPKEGIVHDIQLQTSLPIVVYNVEYPKLSYLGISPSSYDVELFEHEGEYIILFYHDGKLCGNLNEIIELPENIREKEKKIEWALYSKLMKDSSAILTYDVLSPFEDILEINKIIRDSRVDWSDDNLFQLIVSLCDADDWNTLSRYCSPYILQKKVSQYVNQLNWGELTVRLDENFIIENVKRYPWEPKLLLAREPISTKLIESFLENFGFRDDIDEQWDWDEVIPLLDLDFIHKHLHDIPFDLSSLTKELKEENYFFIKDNPEAAWDWEYISQLYPLGFIIDNIENFSNHLNLPLVLDRIFTSQENVVLGVYSDSLKRTVEKSKTELSYVYSVNNKKYIWSDDVICFFESTGLLQWEGGYFQRGFIFNPSIVWDNVFFSKYHNKITSEESIRYVSSQITSNEIIDLFPSFPWDWNILSKNKVVYDDPFFVKNHTTDINANIVLYNCSSNLIEDYFVLLDVGEQLSKDVAIRAKVTDCVSIDFIRKYINCSWDWSRVTRRVYKTMNLDVIGRDFWREKWDWDFLSSVIEIDNILQYADAYSEKWNWMIVLKRIDSQKLIQDNVLTILLPVIDKKDDAEKEWSYLSKTLSAEKILALTNDYSKKWDWKSVLERISSDLLLSDGIIDIIQKNIVGHNDEMSLWKIITQKIKTEQLLDLISHYSESRYLWNYSEIYSREDFNAKDYLDKHSSEIHWGPFSASNSVNKLFAKAKSRKTRSLWLRVFKELLDNENYKWDFQALSHLSNILEDPKLLQLNKDWDWTYISEFAKWIDADKENNYYFNKFVKKLDFSKLSFRTDINITEEVIEFYDKHHNWDWDALIHNSSIDFSIDFIEKYIDKPWDWKLISMRDDLSSSFIANHKEKDWNWYIITSNSRFEPTSDIIEYIVGKKFEINWSAISVNSRLNQEIISKYQTYIIWNDLIENNPSFLDLMHETVAFINNYEQYISWDVLNNRIGLSISTDLIKAYPSKINWLNASKSQNIDFTIDLVNQFIDKWYWTELTDNLKFIENIPNYETVFAKQLMVSKFVNRLKKVNSKPCIYHFTHFYNALDVIRTKKILSRNKALELGLLKFDSAGSVVLRNTAAHPFARFYFRTCTPTQYYNEALGADSKLGEWREKKYKDAWGEWHVKDEWYSKYPQAYKLGLPKCPIPVFFRFDLEEVLAKMPDICWYSDRNMQSNNPRIFKVLDNPDSLGIDYLYKSMEDAYREAKSSGRYDRSTHIEAMEKVKLYSQQEFLIESEFDFSSLSSFQIICYDSEYTALLKQIFEDDPICKKIISYDEDNYGRVFEKENRSVMLRKQVNCYSLSSNYADNFYYLIKGENLSTINFDFSMANVFEETAKKEIKLRGIIKWEITTNPFEIYFVDPQARTKEWLVYNNLGKVQMQPAKFKLEDKIKESLDSFVSVMRDLPIELTKDMFYNHMVNSYHGIAHTTRVLFATYLLSIVSELSIDERRACYYAAIIHDLGKRSDLEGAEHGYNSMLRYRGLIESIVENMLLQERILLAVQYHSVEDKDCPIAVQNDIIWKVLKDADALDRSRFGGRGCDKSFLRLGIYDTSDGQNIIDLASYLPGWTNDLYWDAPYEEIVERIGNFAY